MIGGVGSRAGLGGYGSRAVIELVRGPRWDDFDRGLWLEELGLGPLWEEMDRGL